MTLLSRDLAVPGSPPSLQICSSSVLGMVGLEAMWSQLSPLPVSAGALSVVRALNREEVVQPHLPVVAADHGFPRRSATQLLSILVLDVNDEAPTFEKPEYEAHVMENLPAGSPVLQVLATDRDLGEDAGFNQGPSGDTAHRTGCAPSCLVRSACLTMEGGTVTWPGNEGWDRLREKLMRTETAIPTASQVSALCSLEIPCSVFHKLNRAEASLHHPSLPTLLLARV